MKKSPEKQMVKVEKNQPEEAESAVTFIPQVDIVERPEEFILVADVPGASPDGVEINIEDGVLKLRARVEPPEYGDLHQIYSEYSVGHFARSFTVSREIDQSGIQADLKNGVLKVVFPKLKEQKARRIEVKSG